MNNPRDNRTFTELRSPYERDELYTLLPLVWWRSGGHENTLYFRDATDRMAFQKIFEDLGFSVRIIS